MDRSHANSKHSERSLEQKGHGELTADLTSLSSGTRTDVYGDHGRNRYLKKTTPDVDSYGRTDAVKSYYSRSEELGNQPNQRNDPVGARDYSDPNKLATNSRYLLLESRCDSHLHDNNDRLHADSSLQLRSSSDSYDRQRSGLTSAGHMDEFGQFRKSPRNSTEYADSLYERSPRYYSDSLKHRTQKDVQINGSIGKHGPTLGVENGKIATPLKDQSGRERYATDSHGTYGVVRLRSDSGRLDDPTEHYLRTGSTGIDRSTKVKKDSDPNHPPLMYGEHKTDGRSSSAAERSLAEFRNELLKDQARLDEKMKTSAGSSRRLHWEDGWQSSPRNPEGK